MESTWTPADWIKLIETVFYGMATICIPLATAFIMIGAARAKRAEEVSISNADSIRHVSRNVERLEINTNSISERNEAIAKKLGITEGIAQERASVAAQTAGPLPVADDRTAIASERVAEASERMADAAESDATDAAKVADDKK